jgi:hypothetical protein
MSFSRHPVSQLADGREPDDGLGALPVRAGKRRRSFPGLSPPLAAELSLKTAEVWSMYAHALALR